MEGLFTWIIIAGAIYSFINKALKNPPKPGTGKPVANSVVNSVNQMYLDKIRQFIAKAQMNIASPDLSVGIMPKKDMLAEVALGEGSSKERKYSEGLVDNEGLADYEGSSFGDGSSAYEGTSFGDGIKGFEGESADGRGQIVSQQEDALIIPFDQENKWNFNSENLMSAFVYAEILSQPRCRRNKVR